MGRVSRITAHRLVGQGFRRKAPSKASPCPVCFMTLMFYSLNSLKGVCKLDYIGSIIQLGLLEGMPGV